MDIVFSSTTRLAAAIQAGRVSAVEVLEAHLSQIDKHNSALNAVITLNAEQAHEQAQAADEALARGEVWGPLHGVPFTLKDAHATAGMRTTLWLVWLEAHGKSRLRSWTYSRPPFATKCAHHDFCVRPLKKQNYLHWTLTRNYRTRVN